MVNNWKKTNQGFTLIEMIVSLGVFSVVVTTSVGAILVLISTNQQLQAEQSVMTNLAFALDTMTREMRTGYFYVCDSVANVSGGVTGLTNGSLPVLAPPPEMFNDAVNEHEVIGERTKDCPDGRSPSSNDFQGVSFYEGGDSLTGSGSTRILYYFDTNNKTIMRRVGDEDAQSIVSSGLNILEAEFFVTGSDSLSNGSDTEQPTITVYIEAQEEDDPTGKKYYLNTTVTQRVLDL